jgi:hypothetical protein
MENRSRLPGEPSLDHPGVPTGRGGHRAGMKPLCGISSRLFWCLPALPRKCSDSRVGASSPGKCRSPQTAPRLWRPYLGSIEPSRSPEVVLDAFRASLTGPESCLLQLRPCVHKFQRAQIGRSVMPQRLGCRAGIIYERSALLAAPRIVMGRLCNLLQLTPSEWVRCSRLHSSPRACR